MRKGTIGFSMSLSVRMEQLGSQRRHLHQSWYLSIFRKSVERIRVSLKYDETEEVLYTKTYVYLRSYVALFFLDWEIFQPKFVAKISIHIYVQYCFSPKPFRSWDNVAEYRTAKEVMDDNIARCVRFSCWETTATDTEYVNLKFCWTASWYIRIIWTNKMHYFLLIYFNNKPLNVSSRFAAHHQEDQLFINSNWCCYALC